MLGVGMGVGVRIVVGARDGARNKLTVPTSMGRHAAATVTSTSS
jgi:hypothetical protein